MSYLTFEILEQAIEKAKTRGLLIPDKIISTYRYEALQKAIDANDLYNALAILNGYPIPKEYQPKDK